MACQVDEAAWDQEVVRKYLQGASTVVLPPRVDLQQFTKASSGFFIKFPIDSARVQTHVAKKKDVQKLTDQINSARPILHHRCLPLFASFIHYKKMHGTPVEKAIYENMDLLGLVDRLLRMRPVSFLGRWDQYLLRDGSKGKGGFEKIGTNLEKPPLLLKDYLSYDEMKLSSLLCVSSWSFFINDGRRKNMGVPGNAGSFQEEGVIMGMVGTRLKKVGYVEWQDCIVTKNQNTREHGYGKVGSTPRLQHLWGCLWESALPEWKDVSPEDENIFQINKQNYFNISIYKARMQLSAEILLAEAKSRAISANLMAYIHVVGLGLGVWRACHEQDAWFVDAWGDALKAADTTHVAHVDFSWIGATKCFGVGEGEVFPGTGVTLHFSKRSLHDPVPPGTLLVVTYAWNGNCLPGNEYWLGKLDRTGDGAASSSSGVAELHNVHINANVCGANLHVAGPWGVMHIGEYVSRVLREEPSRDKGKKRLKK